MVSGGIHLFVIPAQAGIHCFYVFIVLDIQVQEAYRTQWIPACAGMTTVFKFLSLKHRHTGLRGVMTVFKFLSFNPCVGMTTFLC